MRGLLRHRASEHICILGEPVGTYRHTALKVVPYEHYLLDVPGLNLGLDIIPFYLLRIGSALIEKHPYYPE